MGSDRSLTDEQTGETPGFVDYCPWTYWSTASEEERAAQAARRARLAAWVTASGGELDLAEDAFISPWAGVFPSRLSMGEHSYIGAHAYVTHDVSMGAHCTLNPFATVRGRIRMGDGVRVGAHTSLLGFNHSMAPDRPVYTQPGTSEGIVIGDDVWIGSNVVVLDGVSIGDHCVVGAGAVVTKDLPAWSIAVGNPARVVRDRRSPRGGSREEAEPESPAGHSESGAVCSARGATGQAVTESGPHPASASLSALSTRLRDFSARARGQAGDLLDRCWIEDDDGVRFLDHPGKHRTVRAWCDAVEIASLLLAGPPPQVSPQRITDYFLARQDPATGLVADEDGQAPSIDGGSATYHILCVGYALELLGAKPPEPIHVVQDMSAAELTARLDALPWRDRAWSAGHWIDAIGTAYYRNSADFGLRAPSMDALFGWLLTRASPWHGMWGEPDQRSEWLQVVNGFYRLTRGTFAQFGLPLPYPERAVDTVLAHAVNPRYFGPARGTACDVLDVIHPLWLAARQTGHRRAEGRAWAAGQLDRVLGSWHDGAGFSFALEKRPDTSSGTDDTHTPGLQGTEMWLAITWLLADYLDVSDALGYRPAGVHRPEPAAAAAG